MVKLIKSNPNGINEYTLDTIADVLLLPQKGISTQSIATLVLQDVNDITKGDIKIYYFTKNFDANGNEINGTWYEF